MEVTNKHDTNTQLSLTPPNGDPLLDLKERVNKVVITTIQELASENHRRITRYEENPNEMLKEGCYYPNEYCLALTKANKTSRLDWFKKKGSFYHGYASQDHFTYQEDARMPAGKHPFRFIMKKDVAPSDALDAMIKGPSLIGCGEVCDLAYYKGIQAELGKEKFDALFASDSPCPFRVGHNCDPMDPIWTLFTTALPSSRPQIKKGQIVGISGSKNYAAKHRFGEDQALNTICIDDTPGAQKFVGLGTPPEGVSQGEIADLLLKWHNKKPITADEILSPDLARKANEMCIDDILSDDNFKALKFSDLWEFVRSPDLKVTKEELIANPRLLAWHVYKEQLNRYQDFPTDKEDFIREGGGKIGAINELRYDRIALLKNASIEEGKKSISSWRK